MRKYEDIVNNKEVSRVSKLEAFGFNRALVVLKDSGESSVLWGENEDGWEHVSVSPKDKTKTPTWDDMCQIKDIFFDDEEEVLQIHPKKSEYINVRSNCLHLWKPKGIDIMDPLRNMALGIRNSYNVGEVVSLCEYVGCDIVDALGNKINCTKENCSEVYKKSVEHIEADVNRVLIYTFDNIDKLGVEDRK